MAKEDRVNESKMFHQWCEFG